MISYFILIFIQLQCSQCFYLVNSFNIFLMLYHAYYYAYFNSSISYYRIIINRKAAHKAKDKKRRYMLELEGRMHILQTKSNAYKYELIMLEVINLKRLHTI